MRERRVSGHPLANRPPVDLLSEARLDSFHNGLQGWPEAATSVVMKVRASVRRMCDKCKIVRRRGVVFVVCADPRHKQRQG